MSQSSVIRDRALVAAVPLLLCAVAATQLYLVNTHDLSRWKGGGFGMFTTVDSPSSRFLRVYLDTPDGEVPVLIPPDLRKLAQKTRVLPSDARMTELMDALREGTWVYLSMVSALQHYRQLLAISARDRGDLVDDIRYSSRDDIGAVDFRRMRLARMLDEDEHPLEQQQLLHLSVAVHPEVHHGDAGETLLEQQPIAVRGVRLEVWQYRFDREELMLRARKVTDHAVTGAAR